MDRRLKAYSYDAEFLRMLCKEFNVEIVYHRFDLDEDNVGVIEYKLSGDNALFISFIYDRLLQNRKKLEDIYGRVVQ